MQKILTKRQKKIEAQRQIKFFIKNNLEPILMEDIKNVLNDVDLPQNWYLKDNYLLSRFVVNNQCEKIFKELGEYSEQTKNEFLNIKNQLKKP